MAKLTLTNIANLQNETTVVSVINANNDAIEAALEKTFSRDGTSPNQIENDIDMNSKRIINLPVPVSASEPARKYDIDNIREVIAPTVEIGTVTTLPPDSQATVTNVGTDSDLILDFGIPQGPEGDVGPAGTGSGNVIGPASSVNNTYALFNGTSGTSIKVGVPYDETKFAYTGEVKMRYGTGTWTGYVRMNGLTIGNASSSATELASANCEDLFKFLWEADENIPVSGGRGATADDDWTGNKTITLPNFQARSPMGLADMGGTASTALDNVTFTTGDKDSLGSTLGSANTSVAKENLPSYNLVVSIPSGQGSHIHATNAFRAANTSVNQTSSDRIVQQGGASGDATASANTLPAMSGTAATGGSGTALVTISPFILISYYMKL